jgi:hypothetical protein
MNDYRNDASADLYADAQKFGREQEAIWGGPPGTAEYWTAWYAGRRAAAAVICEARDMGLTPEQLKRLWEVAAKVAYD